MYELVKQSLLSITDTLTIAAQLPSGQTFFLNGRRFYTETAGSTVELFCAGLSQDADVVFSHSRVDLSSNTSLADNNISFFQDDNVIQLIFNNFTLNLNGNLSCRSRMSGREQSTYIGGTIQSIYCTHIV